MRVLITGMSGSLAALCAERLLEEGHEVVGVDYRPRPGGLRKGIEFYRANYNKRLIEDVFRRRPPHRVLHLGRVGNLKTHKDKRFDLNVVGSAKIHELCLKHGVERLVVLSTFHIYGADPANHIPIYEEDPLRATQRFPQLMDAVQLDNLATTWVYRYPQVQTVVLRPCNIVGPNLRNAISMYLRQRTVAYLLGFSPMWQFIHETDMVRALMLALHGTEVGAFNVAGDGEISLIDALRCTGRRAVPVPASVAEVLLTLGGRRVIPPYFLDFLKYPCVISDARFRQTFGYRPAVGVVETLRSTVHGV